MEYDTGAERSLRQMLDFPREEMSIEIKDWLDLSDPKVRAKIVKHFIALANSGGGYLIFGLAELTSGFQPSGECPFEIGRYSQDEINNAIKKHAEPSFECRVDHLTSSVGNTHVVVEVPGGHISPIMAKKAPQDSGLVNNTYYIRRPGPESAAPQNAREWESLIRRCTDNDHARQTESFRRILGVLRSDPRLALEISEGLGESQMSLVEWTEGSLTRLESFSDDAS